MNNNNNKQLFFSHTWKNDNLDRNTHSRVKVIANIMKKYGWTVWLDEDEMRGNIDACMVNGIKNCECVIACLTTQYIDKINIASNNTRIRDNCFKEWTYANSINKPIIPVILDEDVNTSEGKGILDMYLGNMLYLDLSGNINQKTVNELNTMLLKLNYKPKFNNTVQTNKLKLIKNHLIFNLLRSTANNSNVVALPPIIPRRNTLIPQLPEYPNLHDSNYRKRRYKSTPNFVTL
tara:strand:- start:271 stop:972 length:702 start_codon:yes stop_codon:yes gene_type:complete